MRVQMIAPGLWRWTAEHPEWTPDEDWDREVASTYYEAPDALVLIDPLVPPEREDAFWRGLDGDVARADRPVNVLLTLFWHARSTAAILDRYGGARAWVHEPARELVAERTRFTDVFPAGETLPGGVEALDAGRAFEVLFWIAAHRTLVAGDVLLGDADGGVRLLPDEWLGGADRETFASRMQRLLELPVERILLGHGAPVVEDAQAKLRQAVGQ